MAAMAKYLYDWAGISGKNTCFLPAFGDNDHNFAFDLAH
jgi:hypothetical protein